jgi:hypothetical protein
MTGNMLNGTRISLIELAREENVSIPTVFRWAHRGLRGQRLPTFYRGKRYTTREAFTAWVAAINGETVSCEPMAIYERRVRAAESQADALGL